MRKIAAGFIAAMIWALASGPSEAHGCIVALPDGRVVVTPALVGEHGLVCPPLLLLPNGAVTARTIERSAIGTPGPFTTGNLGPFTTGNIGPFTTDLGRFTTGTAPAPAGTLAPFAISPSGRGMAGTRR